MELALRITEKRTVKTTHTVYQPVGSVAVHISTRRMREKWLEICGDLLSPTKRANYVGFPYYATITGLWRQAWHDACRNYRRGILTLDAAWAEITAGGQLQTDMPNEPNNRVSVLDSWVWSPKERQSFYTVAMDEAAMSATQIDELGRRTYPEQPPVDQPLDPIERVTPGFIMPHVMIDYHADLGLSLVELKNIDDPGIVVDPRLDLPVSPTVFRAVTEPVGVG